MVVERRGEIDGVLLLGDEIEAEASLIDARRSYWVARTELALALGGSIPGSNEGDNR